MQALVTVGAVCLLLGGGVGFWLGDGMATGRCAQREHDVAVAYAEDGNRRVEQARKALAEQHRKAVSRAARDAASEALRLKEAADYELLIARTARPECRRDADAFERLRDAVRAANARARGEAAGVREALPAAAGADRPE